MHLVLPRHPPFHEVDIAGSIDCLGELAGLKDPLLALEDVEVVVGGVKTAMSLSSEWGTENNQVFGDGRMDDVHGTHRTSGIVEHPL